MLRAPLSPAFMPARVLSPEGRGRNGVGVQVLNKLVGRVFEAEAAACYANLGVVFGADAVFHTGQAAGDAGDDVVFGVAEGDGLQQAFEADAGLFLHGRASVLSCSHTPTASTMTKWSLALASGVTALRSSGLMTRTPRPFICSKKPRDLTARMKKTISTGLMSVPVAIMSTVTATLGW